MTATSTSLSHRKRRRTTAAVLLLVSLSALALTGCAASTASATTSATGTQASALTQQQVETTASITKKKKAKSKKKAASVLLKPTATASTYEVVASQNFTRNAALGQFADLYPNYAAYDGYTDTSRNLRKDGTAGVYNSATTTTVHDGVWDCHVYTLGKVPQVCALTLPQPIDTPYGKYEIRFKSTSTSGYKFVGLLWSTRDVWADGELDFPEVTMNKSIQGFAHEVGNPTNQQTYDFGVGATSWHTAILTWTPDGYTYNLDGKTVGSVNQKFNPSHTMRYVFQVESQISSTAPDKNSSGHVLIDWIKISKPVN